MKTGLGDTYDNVTILPVKLRAWLDLTKPASSVGVGGAFMVGSFFFFYYTGQADAISEHYFEIIYASVTAIFAHGASQAMNMAEDAHMDSETEHKQDRPIPSGVVTVEEARTIAWILILMALGRAYLINSTFGLFTTILVFMGVFYNLNPIRAKERIISIPWQAVSRGLMIFPMVWAAYGNPYTATPWILGLFMFFYVLGFQNTADIIDRDIDAKYGINTFVVVFGVKKTAMIATASTIMMIATLGIGINAFILPFRLITMIMIVPLCLYMIHQMWKHPYRVSENTGNHPAWLTYYGGMVLCVVIPLVTEIIFGA